MNQNTYYHQKLAEQLILRTSHGKGLLARVYHLRKMLGSSRIRYEKVKSQQQAVGAENPASLQLSFLFDSQFDSALKNLTKKFPFNQSVDSNAKDFKIVRDNASKIAGDLLPFQQTFTDIHSFMVDALNTLELVRTWLVINFSLYDVASYFLELLSTLFSLLMLLNKIEERKQIMALFGYIRRCEAASNCDLRVESFIADLDPIANLQSKLASLETVFHSGLMLPLSGLFSRRMRDPKKFMDEFNLVMRPNQIAEPFVDIALEDSQFFSPEASYLSLETIEKWMCVMVIVCPRILEDDTLREQWRVLMSNRYALPLFRDVIEKLHELMSSAIQSGNLSRDSKRALEKDIGHSQKIAATQAPTLRKKARLFLRKCLKSNYLILSDVPGLLGMKTQLALIIMGAARDEIHWLVAHCTTEAPGKKGTPPHSDLKEPHLAEMLYYVEKLRNLFKKYDQVIFVYHGSMIKRRNEDLAVIMPQVTNLPEHETTIFSDIINRIKSLPPPTEAHEAGREWDDFQGIRLDWIRLQTYLGDFPQDKRAGFLGLRTPGEPTGMNMAPQGYARMSEIASRVSRAMFGITFSSKMIDYLDNVLNQVSDMSIFFSHLDMFNAHVNALLWAPAPPEGMGVDQGSGGGGKHSSGAGASNVLINQNHLTRHVIAFPMLCAHFINMIAPVAEYVPIERDHVGDLSLTTCNTLLEEICKRACQVIREVCKQHQILSDQLMPRHAPHYGVGGQAVAVPVDPPSGGTLRKKNSIAASVQMVEKPMPGSESARERRDKQVSELDRLSNEMVELVTAINECEQIIVNRFSFAPKEFLLSRLEATFMDQIREMMDKPESMRIKPSDMLSGLKATMSVMQTLESYVSLDMTRLFNTVLMQHSLPLDADGQLTITQYYTKQYIMGFMTSISQSQAVYSDHFKCFISLPTAAPPPVKGQEPQVPFPVEEFSDITELRCLAEMIGPYGVRYINEVISQKILGQYQELKKIANDNAQKLNQIYQLIEAKPGEAVKVGDSLIGKDVRVKVNQFLTMMGAFLALRDLLSTALNDVLKKRVPFLMSCISGLEKPDQRPDANDLAATAGFKVKYYDPILQQLLKIKNFESLRTGTKQENDQLVNCFITLFGLSLPDIVELHNLPYNKSYETSGSNALCIGKAVNSIITMTLLMLPQPEEEYIRNCFVRFLTHASSCVLRMSESTGATSPGESGGDQGTMSAATLLLNRRSRDTTYLVLKQIVEDCPYLSMDALEAVFPYTLVRCAFHNSHLKEPPPRPVRQS